MRVQQFRVDHGFTSAASPRGMSACSALTMASTAAAAAAGSGQPAPGIRAAKLSAVFAKALATCVASGKGIDLGEVFPTLYPEHKDTIDELFGNLLDMVQEASSVGAARSACNGRRPPKHALRCLRRTSLRRSARRSTLWRS